MKGKRDMEVSDAQMSAVMSGLEPNKPTWEPLELPTQVRDLPKWIVGAHVDLMIHASNSPEVRFKTTGDPWPKGEPKLYENEGDGAWTARSSDGFVMSRHYHSGSVREHWAWRVVRGGKLVTQSNPEGWMISDGSREQCVAEAERHLELCRKLKTPFGAHESQQKQAVPEAAEYVAEYKTLLATQRQNGYGGRHFQITLKNGQTLVLRGPWHGGSPLGWTDGRWVDMSDPYNRRPDWRPVRGSDDVVRKRLARWYERGGLFGYYFSEELIMKAVARYAPHLGVARVYPGYGHAHVEFYDLAWGAPKMFAETRLPGWGMKR